MNRAIRTATVIRLEGNCSNPFQLRPSFFHSSPILERRRRTQWDSWGGAYRGTSRRFNNSNFNKRFRKLDAKQQLLRNVSAFAEDLFQTWRYEQDEYNTSSSKKNSWFRQEFYPNGNRGGRLGSQWSKAGNRRRMEFCEDDDFEVEDMFRGAFGGNQYFFWSFTNDPEREYSSSYSYNTRNRRNWRYQSDDEYDSSEEFHCSGADLSSHRLTLGLKASGPLSLDDVKTAYRACALKWHPDRHQGPSKAVAEEKFKVCSAAYQSLCDKLAVN